MQVYTMPIPTNSEAKLVIAISFALFFCPNPQMKICKTTKGITMKTQKRVSLLLTAILLIMLLAACTPSETPTESPITPTKTAIPKATPTQQPIEIPKARGYHMMVYDTESRKVVMFGGQTGSYMQESNNSTETWSFDPITKLWKKMSPSVAPGPSSGGYMTYDSHADRAILVIGADLKTPYFFDYQTTQTWAYDYNSDAWTRLADSPYKGNIGPRLAYDAESDKTIMFGGMSAVKGIWYVNETWAFDYNSNTWEQMQSADAPKNQNYQCMAYDPKSDKVINWGGERAGNLSLYDYNTDQWQTIETSGPSASYYCGFTYNSRENLFLLYGGTDTGTNETWIFDPVSNAWEQLQPEQTPGKLSRHTLVYDPITDRAILFGGQIEGAVFWYSSRTWVYDFKENTWTEVLPGQ